MASNAGIESARGPTIAIFFTDDLSGRAPSFLSRTMASRAAFRANSRLASLARAAEVVYVPGSGGAPKFLAFFKNELIPFIETKYRADASQRVLMGSSFGGTFTLYALFSEPGLFHGYVAASPVTVYGDRFAFTQEAEYAKSHKDLPVRLFVSVGALEDLREPVEEFVQVLSQRGYTGLELEARTIEGERHAGNKPEAFNRGLRFVFQDK